MEVLKIKDRITLVINNNNNNLNSTNQEITIIQIILFNSNSNRVNLITTETTRVLIIITITMEIICSSNLKTILNNTTVVTFNLNNREAGIIKINLYQLS